MDPVVPQHQPPNNRLYQEQPKNVNNLSNMFKLFKEQHKYNGITDFLDQKLKIFYDLCQNFGVHKQQFLIAFPAILKDEVHEYYYDNLAEQGLSFMEICSRLKMHFETEERKYEILNQWYDLSLVSHIRKNPELSTLACFQLLVPDMQKIRRGLDKEYQTDKAMKERLQLACRNIKACPIVILKPASSFEALCADICLSISIKSKFTQINNNFIMGQQLTYHGNNPKNLMNLTLETKTPHKMCYTLTDNFTLKIKTIN
ncbi:hypothetical protein GcM3_002021 [Golovinomyces cichoracearum]|uniref:Integrase and RNaseH domain-containing protein n=1 Tax=Golovinomyces cichoracearum TaxID=62708 RepID=A0A420JB91_9PEZI|nr:hypothetical protein GcM3_002021 [Golovinomyces cichoracearum]